MENLTTLAATVQYPSVFTSQESSIIRLAMGLIEEKSVRNKPVLQFYEDFERYLIMRFAGLRIEEFHVLYLDFDRRLLAAESVSVGDQRSVQPDMRHIVHHALGLGADSLVFAHNHPNDNAMPSDGDLNHLNCSERSLSWLNITVLDSYVVTSKTIASIKQYRQREQELRTNRMVMERDAERVKRRAKLAANKAAKLQGATA